MRRDSEDFGRMGLKSGDELHGILSDMLMCFISATTPGEGVITAYRRLRNMHSSGDASMAAFHE